MQYNNFAYKEKPSRLGAVSIPTEAAFHVIIGLFSILCVIPFIFVIIISFTSEASIREIGYSFVPAEWGLEGYKYVIETGEVLWRSYFNSFFVSIVGTLLSMLICVMYAYALFRPDYKYRRFFTFFSFFTMIFTAGLTPTYVVSRQFLGLVDNYPAIIVPLLVNPFNLIIMRSFFKSSVPESIIEASAIDGAGEYRTLFQIIIPISTPGIATVSLLTVIAYWNDWFNALLFLSQTDRHMPLQPLLWQMQNNIDYLAQNMSRLPAGVSLSDLPSTTLRMALVVIVVIPIACAYPFFQRFIISGLTVGSVKE